MSEERFRKSVIKWSEAVVKQWKKKKKGKIRSVDRLIVASEDESTVTTGWMPRYDHRRDIMIWHPFPRQIDVIIGLKDSVDEEETLIPLIAMELKTGKNLNTDELDKKSAIYGSLKEVYPWTYTAFINQSKEERGMREVSWLRNGRQFNAIYRDWDPRTRKLLRRAIEERLDYQLQYWSL